MNCPYCNTPLLGSLTICPKCKYDTTLPDGGECHISWIKENGDLANICNSDKKSVEKQYGTGWMNFYIKWRFPIALILGIFSIFSSLGSVLGVSGLPGIIYGFLIWDIFTYVFLIPVYINMLKMNILGYNLNIGLLVIESINLALRSAMRQVQTGSDFASALVIALPLGFLIWFLPNYTYFSHRKYMFEGNSADQNTPQNVQTETVVKALPVDEELHSVPISTKSAIESTLSSNGSIMFCRYCGSRIDENSLFCKTCGKALSSIPVTQPEKEEPAQNVTLSIPFSSLPPKLHRAFIFLEDEEWNRADQYFESILDDDPTNAYAYLGKAMADLKIQQVSDLVCAEAIKENKNYQKALKYATGSLRSQLDSL